MKSAVFVDTETYPIEIGKNRNGREEELHRLYLGWLFFIRYRDNQPYIRDEYMFTRVPDFWQYLENISGWQGLIRVFAFNMDFDANILGIRDIPHQRGWTLATPQIRRTTYSWNMSFKGKKYRFLDVGNFIGGSTNLKGIGEAVGLEKLDVDLSHGKTVKDYPIDMISRYCHRDVEIIEKYIDKWVSFLNEHNCGDFKNTLAAQCMTAYRHKYPDIVEKILVHGIGELMELERKAFHGGWVEMYYRGDVANVYKLDVNSFYPYIMKTKDLPYRRVEDDFDNDGNQAAFIIDADIYTPDRLIPVMHEGHLVFPVGSFRTQFTSVEYDRLLEIGGKIIKEYRRQYYDTMNLFEGYITEFHELKQHYSETMQPLMRNMAKYFMNALVGKFAQRFDKMICVGDTNVVGSFYETYPDGSRIYVQCFGGKKYITDGKEEGHYNFIPIAAFVSAWARVYLSRWIGLVRDKGGHVFYTDTDSVFVDETGYQALSDAGLIGDELGQLQLEDFGDVQFRNLKDYTANGKNYHKGIKPSARVQLDGTYVQDKFLRSNGLNKRGLSEGVIVTKNVPIKLKGAYNKGTVTESGWVAPIRLSLEN